MKLQQMMRMLLQLVIQRMKLFDDLVAVVAAFGADILVAFDDADETIVVVLEVFAGLLIE